MKSTAAANHSPQTSAFTIPVASMGQPPTLLVVEDDPALRDLEVEVLSSHGYNVLQAECAAEALRLAMATEAIHLLVTDFSMPVTNGLELVRKFRAVHPQAPVLMLSGSFPEIHPKAKDLPRFAIMAKPFSFDELLHKVRTLLTEVSPLPLRTD